MFFNIGYEQDDNFPVHVKHGSLCIDLDQGWDITSTRISKGLEKNSCTLLLGIDGIDIEFDTRRTFPLYYTDSNVSNLYTYQNTYSSNEGLILFDGNVRVKKTFHSTKFKDLNLNDNQLLDLLYDYIDTKVKTFDSDLPIKLFPTGGVDISLLISFVLKHNKPYELLTYEYKDMDYFTCHNRSAIGNNWAYRDIHYWNSPAILLSGTHGDEMMLRFPQHAYMLGKANNENILEVLKETPSLYHSHYFLRSKHKHLYTEADQLALQEDQIKDFILGRNSFDYQHWHLGKTLTWTPLNDLEISNIMLNFSYSTLRGQLLDASISKELIKRNSLRHLQLVSQQKNVNHFNHLYKLFEGTDTLT